tara:strand:+ start:9875 stop:11158 length:1284 start_codon:yes stop_codon:yes gene_type:complete
MITEDTGDAMHGWARDMFPYPRSLSGPGVEQTFAYLSDLIAGLKVHRVSTGTQAFDWTVPDEWAIRDAYIENEAGERIICFSDNNLHLVGYSEPVDVWLNLDDLQDRLYSLPEQPDAIPYVTSYYKRRWGFCLSENQRKTLKPGKYHAVIDADLKPGHLKYGEIIIPGREQTEVMLSTYICHPSMGNNEMSGVAVATALARWLQSAPRRHTYRIIFVPETIGSIIYLSKHLAHLKKHLISGFVLTCMGDERTYSLMPSRTGKTLADRVALHSLKQLESGFDHYSFLQRGSDERQYCSPLVDLPVVSIMRSKYATYPEYHTSLDDLDLITPQGLQGGYEIIKRCLQTLEMNYTYKATMPCEPQLGKRGLYPTLSRTGSADQIRDTMNVLAYADGTLDIIDMAETIGIDALDANKIAEILFEHELLERM